MFYSTFSFFKFLLKSQNQHGLHSPFVYDFVTKGLYTKQNNKSELIDNYELNKLSKKQQNILSKIISYFNIDTIHFDYKVFKNTSDINYKLLFISDITKINELNFSKLSSKHFILIDGIYSKKNTTNQWRELIKNNHACVTIDLFYFAIIFFRKEQAKEHFIIRP